MIIVPESVSPGPRQNDSLRRNPKSQSQHHDPFLCSLIDWVGHGSTERSSRRRFRGKVYRSCTWMETQAEQASGDVVKKAPHALLDIGDELVI